MNTIIDVHSHLWAKDWLPTAYWESMVDVLVRASEKQGRSRSPTYVRENYLPTYWDPEGEKLLERIEEAGIDRQVIFSIDWGIPLGEPETPIEEVNERVASIQHENSDSVLAFAALDPRRDDAVEHLETALGDWDMRGLKLHPTGGFHLHDEATYELLEVAVSHDVPVLTDTGPISAPLYSKYSHPVELDEVLVDFPDLDLVAAHMSLGWWRDLLAIAEMKGNNTGLHVDISGWQDRAESDPEEFAEAVRGFVDALGADRVLFGTDDPVYDPTFPKEEWIETVRSLADREREPTFTDDEVSAILGAGSAALLT